MLRQFRLAPNTTLIASLHALAFVACAEPARAQEPDAEARAALLRAMVIVKIAPYVGQEGTDAAKRARYRIGVVGDDATVAAAKEHLPGKKVNDAVVCVDDVTPADAANGKATAEYHMLYIAASVDTDTLAKIVAAHAKKPVVLVCERAGFAAAGGGVQLFVHENCIRFEINGDALKKQGLRPSTHVLKYSRKGPR